MKSLLQRITPFLIALYLIIVLSGTTNADFEIISERKLVEKVVIDSVSTKGVESSTSSTAPSSKTEESKSDGICAAEESLKLAACQIFVENEVAFDFSWEEGSGALVCEPRRIVLSVLHQSNLAGDEGVVTYRCPRIVQSVVLAAEGYIYYVSQRWLDSPAVLYTQRNAFSPIHPFKAVARLDLQTLAGTRPRSYDKIENILGPISPSYEKGADTLADQAIRRIAIDELTHPYEKFLAYYSSINVCGMTRNEKLFVCKYFVFDRIDSADKLEMEVDAYLGSECRRRDTVLIQEDADVDVVHDFGHFAQFRCPPAAWYSQQQQQQEAAAASSASGSGSGGSLLKKYFDHAARLLSSHFAPASAFLLETRYQRVAATALVSGIDDENLARVRSLRRHSRVTKVEQPTRPQASYRPARQHDEYKPLQFMETNRDRVEQAILAMERMHAMSQPHERFAASYSAVDKIRLSDVRGRDKKLELCQSVFGHQVFGYKITSTTALKRHHYEFYVHRLDQQMKSDDKQIASIVCKTEEHTENLYAELIIAGGIANGGLLALVRDFKTETTFTPLAVLYPGVI